MENFVPEILPTEIVPLPSNGLTYPENNFFHQRKMVSYKSMTPYHEDILLNAAFRKENSTIEKLISACLDQSNVDVSKLLLGDKNAIMVALFISNYGRLYELGAACPNCEENVTIPYDLTKITIKKLEIKPVIKNQNLFEFVLPKSKRKIKFKFPTIKDEKNNEASNDTNLATWRLYQSIVEVEGDSNPETIYRTVNSMSAFDSLHLRNYIDSHEPGLDLSTIFACSNCDYSCGINIPNNHDFFSLKPEHREAVLLEPFFLLGYYFGMDWDTYYYKFPVTYKKWLIERIQREISEAAKANEQGGSQIPSKAAHHNDPSMRALAGKRPNVPAKLRRF